VEQREAKQVTFLAERAEVEALAGELVKERLPISRRGGEKERSRIDIEQLAAAGDFILDLAIGQEAEVAEADKAAGQDVEQEAAKELDGVKGEGFFDTAVAVILPAEADAAVLDFQQAVVGDGDAVGVATEILDDLCRAAEGGLGIDNPALSAGCR
jgi:hypothetical protein